MLQAFTRQTARICRLADIAQGEWVQHPSPEPSGIQTPFGLLSRVNVLGTVIERPNDLTLVIDDGSEQLTARTFDPMPGLAAISVGDVVLVVGKPREFNGKKYIALEICRKLGNKQWIEYRKRELSLLFPKEEKPSVVKSQPKKQGNPLTVIIEAIRKLDDGSGVSVDVLFAHVEIPDAEDLLRALIEEGEVFEIKPGRVKVLE